MPEKSSRARGTGSLRERTDSTRERSWVGVWRELTGKQVKRALGPVRVKGSPVGLSKTETEQEVRKRMEGAVRPADARVTPQSIPLTVRAVADLIGERSESRGRRPAMIRAFDVYVRVHLVLIGAAHVVTPRAVVLHFPASAAEASRWRPAAQSL